MDCTPLLYCVGVPSYMANNITLVFVLKGMTNELRYSVNWLSREAATYLLFVIKLTSKYGMIFGTSAKAAIVYSFNNAFFFGV